MTQTTKPLYVTLAECQAAQTASIKKDNREWVERWGRHITSLVSLLPSGSGVDTGTEMVSMSDNHLVMRCGFHHMNEHGVYDGWTNHTIRVTPGWGGINVVVTGPNREGVREHLSELYYTALTTHVVWEEYGKNGEGGYDMVREEPTTFTGDYKREGQTIKSPDGYPLVVVKQYRDENQRWNLSPAEVDALAWYFTSCLNRPGVTLHAIKTAYARTTTEPTE